jgi:uncharacterized protein (DUF1697 family)
MQTYVALFRGINIVGNNRLSMNDLRRLLEQNSCVAAQTYIQSGNAVFRSRTSDAARLAKRLSAAVLRACGFEPLVLLLTPEELERAVAGNPFPEAEADPKSVHLFFLVEPPKKARLESLDLIKTATERYELKNRIFYLHTPDGFGRSKLAANVERLLGVAATARNWRTVMTLVGMVSVSAESGRPLPTDRR